MTHDDWLDREKQRQRERQEAEEAIGVIREELTKILLPLTNWTNDQLERAIYAVHRHRQAALRRIERSRRRSQEPDEG